MNAIGREQKTTSFNYVNINIYNYYCTRIFQIIKEGMDTQNINKY